MFADLVAEVMGLDEDARDRSRHRTKMRFVPEVRPPPSSAEATAAGWSITRLRLVA